MEKIRVVAFDDFADIRDMYEILINGEEDMLCVNSFPDCNNVIKRIEQTLPDVVLMDIAMPGINGIEGVRLLKSKFPNLKIIMQTVFEDGDRIF
ncbi:MAG: response regulator transcription factor [Bacteroidetes bacterium]|nr:response regulator transcription factor [Bacteroidota bacterium]